MFTQILREAKTLQTHAVWLSQTPTKGHESMTRCCLRTQTPTKDPLPMKTTGFRLRRSLQEAKHFWKRHTVFAQLENPERPKSSESIWLLLVQTPPKSQKSVNTYGFAHPEAPRKHRAGTAGAPANRQKTLWMYLVLPPTKPYSDVANREQTQSEIML